MTPEYELKAAERCGLTVKRGEKIANKLAALIVEKMEKRAHHGDWKDYSLFRCAELIEEELDELKRAFFYKKTRFGVTALPPEEEEEFMQAFFIERKAAIRDEITDVAAYCAIMLDVLEKE